MTSPLARGGGWAPDKEAALGEGDEPVDGEHEHGEDHHAGEHARGVEVALGLLDQVTEAGGGAQDSPTTAPITAKPTEVCRDENTQDSADGQ